MLDGKVIGNETTNIYKQNLVPNGFYILSGIDNVLMSGYCKSPSRYENVDWYADEVIKIQKNEFLL